MATLPAAGQHDRGPAAASPSMRHAEPTTGRSPSWRWPTATRASPASTSPGRRTGFPPDPLPATRSDYLQRNNAFYTIHAGEADRAAVDLGGGPASAARNRIGHGVRIIDDITLGRDGTPDAGSTWPPTSATSRSRWRCARRPTCRPVRRASIAEHPIGLLRRARLPGHGQQRQPADERHPAVREFALLCGVLDYALEDVRRLTLNAARAAFAPLPVRQALVELITAYAPDAWSQSA